jgi:hypothetical protein
MVAHFSNHVVITHLEVNNQWKPKDNGLKLGPIPSILQFSDMKAAVATYPHYVVWLVSDNFLRNICLFIFFKHLIVTRKFENNERLNQGGKHEHETCD